MLRQRSADMHTLCVPFEDIREATNAKLEAERQLKRLTDHPHNGGFNLPEADARVVTAEKHVTKASEDLRRLKERSEMRAQAWQAASQARAACETWLRDGRPLGTTLLDHDGPEPKLAKGENGLLDAIENRRRRVRELRADLHRIRSAPFPSSYAKARIREQIEALAMQGAPSVSRLVELDGPVDFQTQRVQSEVYNTGTPSIAFAELEAATPLLIWLHAEAIIKRLDAEIDAEADDKAALSHEARQKAEAEVQGDLLAIERDECALVWQAQAQGLPCEHRADVSVAALLSITLETTTRDGQTPETTPGYSWPWRR
jgi:hypothetical protein